MRPAALVSWGLLVVFSTFAVAGATQLATASSAQRTETIAFLRGEGLFFIDPDGGDQRSARVRAKDFPAWSPDGRRIAFVIPGSRSQIAVMDADGRNRHALTPPRFHDCISLEWSPTGRQIAYSRNPGCESEQEVWVVDVATQRQRRLTRRPRVVYEFAPAWSSDGRWLVLSTSSRREGLVRIRPNGRDRRVIRGAEGATTIGTPMRAPAAWSRDGRRIFYIGRNRGLYIIGVNGSGRRRISPGGTVVLSFALSPNRRLIALGAAPADNRPVQIAVMNADGSGFRELTTRRHPETNLDPQWSPDGRRIVFTRRASVNAPSDLYVVNVDGSGERNLTRSPADEVAPAWGMRR